MIELVGKEVKSYGIKKNVERNEMKCSGRQHILKL